MMQLSRRAWFALCSSKLAAASLAASGCAGYQVGNHTLYRQDIRTVHVPVFESDSFRPFLGERLTESVIKQIELHTPYKVVGSKSADSTLQGRVLNASKQVLVENSFDEPRELEVGMRVQVAWINHLGQPLCPPQHFPIPAELVDISQSTNYVPEVGQSMVTQEQVVINRLAQQIVSTMEMPW